MALLHLIRLLNYCLRRNIIHQLISSPTTLQKHPRLQFVNQRRCLCEFRSLIDPTRFPRHSASSLAKIKFPSACWYSVSTELFYQTLFQLVRVQSYLEKSSLFFFECSQLRDLSGCNRNFSGQENCRDNGPTHQRTETCECLAPTHRFGKIPGTSSLICMSFSANFY